METKTISIVHAREEYICHQCNCVTHSCAGLAKTLFDKYEYANCYATRWEPDIPGTIHYAMAPENNLQNIINMFAQYHPGAPREGSDPGDSSEHRKKYFIDCLKAVKKLNPKSLAFPIRIGCGLAQGSWEWYSSILQKFEDSTKIRIVLYDYSPK